MDDKFIEKLKELLQEFDTKSCKCYDNCPLYKNIIESGGYYLEQYDICDILTRMKRELITEQ